MASAAVTVVDLASASLPLLLWFRNEGIAIAARMPMIRITTRSSISVKPLSSWKRWRIEGGIGSPFATTDRTLASGLEEKFDLLDGIAMDFASGRRAARSLSLTSDSATARRRLRRLLSEVEARTTRIVDAAEGQLYRQMVTAGIWLTFGVCATALAYSVVTWEHAHRGLVATL